MVHCPTLNFFYYDTLSEKEKARLKDLEPFDEFEVMIKMHRYNVWLFRLILNLRQK